MEVVGGGYDVLGKYHVTPEVQTATALAHGVEATRPPRRSYEPVVPSAPPRCGMALHSDLPRRLPPRRPLPA